MGTSNKTYLIPSLILRGNKDKKKDKDKSGHSYNHGDWAVTKEKKEW